MTGDILKIGFIGLGNVGGKLAGSILRNGYDLTVRDLDRAAAQPFLDAGGSCQSIVVWIFNVIFHIPTNIFPILRGKLERKVGLNSPVGTIFSF